jgi:hypothetical protein
MDANVAQVLPQARLEERARVGIERLPRRIQCIVHDLWRDISAYSVGLRSAAGKRNRFRHAHYLLGKVVRVPFGRGVRCADGELGRKQQVGEHGMWPQIRGLARASRRIRRALPGKLRAAVGVAAPGRRGRRWRFLLGR